MKHLFFSAIATMALAIGMSGAFFTEATAAPYATVERVGVYDSSCGCTVPSLSVKVGAEHTDYIAVGTDGLTSEIYFDQGAAVDYVQASYGVEPHAILQPGGYGAVLAGADGILGTDDDTQEHDSAGW